jgi:ribosomal subunit interface protein
MKIVIKTKNLKLQPIIKDFIEKKLNNLEKFAKIFQSEKYFDSFFGKGKPTIEAWVEIGKTTKHHKKGEFFFAECQMRFPKKTLRAVAQSENLKSAISKSKEELERQIKQYKEKPRAKIKRGARIFKKEIKLAPEARFYRKGRIREEGI